MLGVLYWLGRSLAQSLIRVDVGIWTPEDEKTIQNLIPPLTSPELPLLEPTHRFFSDLAMACVIHELRRAPSLAHCYFITGSQLARVTQDLKKAQEAATYAWFPDSFGVLEARKMRAAQHVFVVSNNRVQRGGVAGQEYEQNWTLFCVLNKVCWCISLRDPADGWDTVKLRFPTVQRLQTCLDDNKLDVPDDRELILTSRDGSQDRGAIMADWILSLAQDPTRIKRVQEMEHSAEAPTYMGRDRLYVLHLAADRLFRWHTNTHHPLSVWQLDPEPRFTLREWISQREHDGEWHLTDEGIRITNYWKYELKRALKMNQLLSELDEKGRPKIGEDGRELKRFEAAPVNEVFYTSGFADSEVLVRVMRTLDRLKGESKEVVATSMREIKQILTSADPEREGRFVGVKRIVAVVQPGEEEQKTAVPHFFLLYIDTTPGALNIPELVYELKGQAVPRTVQKNRNKTQWYLYSGLNNERWQQEMKKTLTDKPLVTALQTWLDRKDFSFQTLHPFTFDDVQIDGSSCGPLAVYWAVKLLFFDAKADEIAYLARLTDKTPEGEKSLTDKTPEGEKRKEACLCLYTALAIYTMQRCQPERWLQLQLVRPLQGVFRDM